MSYRTGRCCCSAHLAAAAVLAGLAGCSLLRPAPRAPVPAPAAIAPAPTPTIALPTATHLFTIDAAHDDVVGVVQRTTVGPDDTLPDIARRFNVGYEEMLRANPGVDPWLPGAGHEVIVPTRFVLPDAPHEGIVINVAAMRLYYFPKRAKGQPQTVVTHPIGIGKVGWSTPEGATKVIMRVKDPVWVPPRSVRKEHLENGDVLPKLVPAGPDNPLGAFMFRLGWPGYLIHGTNKAYGVGMRSSHGCVRLYPEDIAILYETVPIGTTVRVVNQPVLLGWQGDSLYVQVYGALEDDARAAPRMKAALAKARMKSPLWQKIRARSADIDWERIQALTATPRGLPVAVTKADAATLTDVVAAAQQVQNVLPVGATWDGRTELLVDEKQFAEMLGEREPAAKSTAPESSPPTHQ